MRADDVEERGLAGAVRADQRDELALLDGQVHVVDGARLAEVFLEVDRLQEAHERPPAAWRRARASVPTMPVGSTITRTTSTTPSRSCQYCGARDRIGLEIVEDDRADDRAGEVAEAAEHGHEHDLAGERPVEDVGRGEPVERHPQDAGKAGEHAGDHEGDPAVAPHRMPTKLARVSLSRIACSALPNGECTITHMITAADREQDQHIVVVGVDEALERAGGP